MQFIARYRQYLEAFVKGRTCVMRIVEGEYAAVECVASVDVPMRVDRTEHQRTQCALGTELEKKREARPTLRTARENAGFPSFIPVAAQQVGGEDGLPERAPRLRCRRRRLRFAK